MNDVLDDWLDGAKPFAVAEIDDLDSTGFSRARMRAHLDDRLCQCHVSIVCPNASMRVVCERPESLREVLFS